MERKRKLIPSARARVRANQRAKPAVRISFSDLPFSIATHILVRLPIKSILICKRVCRTWNMLISDPHFAKLHFHRSPLSFIIRTSHPSRVSRTLHLLDCEYQSEIFDNQWIDKLNYVILEPKFKLPLRYPNLIKGKRDNITGLKPKDYRFDVANSCNGLLCLCDPCNKHPVVVCNPITSEFIRLPEVTRTEKFQIPICSGVGFQPKTNEYKVIRMWNDFTRVPNDVVTFEGLFVEVHTLGTPLWSNVEVDRDVFSAISRLEYPTCVNGAIHWILFHSWTFSIVCFNFESEILQFFPSPPFIHSGIPCREGVSMGTLGDSLFICNASFFNTADMWVMKEYGTEKSWTRVYIFDTYNNPHSDMHLCFPLKHLKKGASILDYHSDEGFTYYEPRKFRFKRFIVCGTPIKSFQVIPHIPSLISLKDLVKGDDIEVLNVHSQCANLKLQEECEDLYLTLAFRT